MLLAQVPQMLQAAEDEQKVLGQTHRGDCHKRRKGRKGTEKDWMEGHKSLGALPEKEKTQESPLKKG